MSQTISNHDCSYPTMRCLAIPVTVRLEVESRFEVIPKRYCQRHADEQEWNTRLGTWGLIALSILPLWAAGFLLADKRVPAPLPMSLPLFLIAFGIILWSWALRHPMSPVFHRLRRKHARRFLKDWTAERIRDDGPFVIENWGQCMTADYLNRMMIELQSSKGQPKIMADALDRIQPTWFDTTYDSLLDTFLNQRSSSPEIKEILDAHRPQWPANNPVLRAAFAATLANSNIAEFNRLHSLLQGAEPQWLRNGLFQDFPNSFHQIVSILLQHQSVGTPDVMTVPENRGNWGEWPMVVYTDVYKYDHSSNARVIWLESILALAEHAVANSSLSTVAPEDLRQLATLENIGVQDSIGSYTETYQSNPDTYSHDETIVVKGWAWVKSCQNLQHLATKRLALS